MIKCINPMTILAWSAITQLVTSIVHLHEFNLISCLNSRVRLQEYERCLIKNSVELFNFIGNNSSQ